jgi:hypothetical protein
MSLVMDGQALTIRDDDWDWIGPEGNHARDRLMLKHGITVNGVLFHVEAWKIVEEHLELDGDAEDGIGKVVGYTQRAVEQDDELAAVARGVEADGPFHTLEFFGDRYVVVITPEMA